MTSLVEMIYMMLYEEESKGLDRLLSANCWLHYT